MPEDDRDGSTVSEGVTSTTLVWAPVIAGVSLGFGLFVTRRVGRLFSATPATKRRVQQTAATAASESVATPELSEMGDLPSEAYTELSAKTFRGLPYGGDFKNPMDISEAAFILGCRETSSKKVIDRRFRKLMIVNHPDKGGSPYLAGKINEAKQVLSRTK